MPDGFLAAVAGNPREGMVDVKDDSIGAGDQNALLRVLENTGIQRQFLFEALGFGNVDHHGQQPGMPTQTVIKGTAVDAPPEAGAIGAKKEAFVIDREIPVCRREGLLRFCAAVVDLRVIHE